MSTTSAGPRPAEFRMKVVGRRIVDYFDWDDIDRLLDTAAAIRGTRALVPRGLYRFKTFEEADEWMTKMIVRTHVSQARKTLPKSAGL